MPQMWKANKYEDCKYVQSTPWGTSHGALQVHCARLMPSIPMGRPKVTPVPISKTLFVNAADCNPGIAARINTQNYITAKAPVSDFKDPHYDFGSSLQVEALDEFMQSCRLTKNVDRSVDHTPS